MLPRHNNLRVAPPLRLVLGAWLRRSVLAPEWRARTIAGVRGRGWRWPIGSTILSLAPRLAEAHGITSAGNWSDELEYLIPIAAMVAVAVILARPTKSTGEGQPDPPQRNDS